MRRDRPLVERLGHADFHALLTEPGREVLANVGVLLPVMDGAATLADAVDIAAEHLVLALFLILETPPAQRAAPIVEHPERDAAGGEVLMEPVAATRCRRDQPAGLVLLDLHQIAPAGLPRPRA